jgi:hypothetical protein
MFKLYSESVNIMFCPLIYWFWLPLWYLQTLLKKQIYCNWRAAGGSWGYVWGKCGVKPVYQIFATVQPQGTNNDLQNITLSLEWECDKFILTKHLVAFWFCEKSFIIFYLYFSCRRQLGICMRQMWSEACISNICHRPTPYLTPITYSNEIKTLSRILVLWEVIYYILFIFYLVLSEVWDLKPQSSELKALLCFQGQNWHATAEICRYVSLYQKEKGIHSVVHRNICVMSSLLFVQNF